MEPVLELAGEHLKPYFVTELRTHVMSMLESAYSSLVVDDSLRVGFTFICLMLNS
jgi:hypothetical protein